MSGRTRLPPRQKPRGFQPPPRRGHSPLSPPRDEIHSPPFKEEIEFAMRRDEIRTLRTYNHSQTEENAALRKKIAAAKEEIHELDQEITKIRGDEEDEAMELIRKNVKIEKELRGFEPLRDELLKLDSEAQKIDGVQKELSRDVENLSKDLHLLQMENQQIPALRLEINDLHQELLRARLAYDYEKREKAEQMVEMRQVLGEKLEFMVMEMERLRAEHMHMVEKRAMGSDSFSNLLRVYGKKASVSASVKKVVGPTSRKINKKTVKKSVNSKRQVAATFPSPSLSKSGRRNYLRRRRMATALLPTDE